FARGGPAAGGPEGPEPPLSARCTNAGVSVLEVPPEQQRDPGRLQRYSIEHVDLGAHYYRDYFHGKEHSNYFGVDEKLGPVAVSIRRERLEDHKEHGPQYQYRLIFRTSELATLRGSIPEDAIPTTTKPGTGRGLPLKDALEYVVPELNIHCLRLALTAAPAKVTEQLLKLDEQGVSGGPADSTGTHSLYTTYQDYEIMFHVSTMLPYTPNNRQQLLRKRHIGNDIVTIVFQEPGALPFTPQSVRSHFQHVFIVVRAHSPCTDSVCYSGGDHVLLRAPDESPGDIQEIVQRLKVVTSGCETVDMTLRRNGLGQLGFHVRYDGTVAEVEEYGFAWQAGLRQGSRLVEICKVAVVTLSHDQMIDLLRTSVTVKVVIVPPHEDGTPRRGWAESLEAQGTEPKAEPESAPTGYRPPYRSHSAWQWNGPASHNPGGRWSEALPLGHGQSLSRPPKQAPAAVPYRDPQPPHGKRPVSFPETPHLASPAGTERPQPYRQPSGSFSTPGSSGAIFTRYKPSPERYAAASPRSLLPFEPPNYGPDAGSSGDSSSGGLASQDSTMERHKPEPLWHVPAPARLPAATAGLAKRPSRQELAGKDSPNRPPKYSSHSSSNTLSSNASSSHSDEPWFDAPDPAEPEPDPASVGGSSDSGIDTALYTSSPGARPTRPTPAHAAGLPDNGKRREPVPAGQSWGYRHKGYVGSAESYKPPGTRQGYPVPGYKAPTAETPRPAHGPQPGSFPLSASVPKSFFSKQAARAKHSAGWRRLDESPARPPEPKRQVAASPRNVFGQPRLRASLRDLRSPRKSPKSSIEDDLKKLIIMDAVSPEPDCDGVSPKMLQRTLSDESLCSGRRDPSYAAAPTCFDLVLASDVLSGSAFPSSTLPVRRQPGPGPSLPEKSAISASELSLVDTRDKPVRRLDPGLMPLPDTAAGLEWSSLVNAAKAYEGRSPGPGRASDPHPPRSEVHGCIQGPGGFPPLSVGAVSGWPCSALPVPLGSVVSFPPPGAHRHLQLSKGRGTELPLRRHRLPTPAPGALPRGGERDLLSRPPPLRLAGNSPAQPNPSSRLFVEPSVDLPGKVCQLEAMLKQLHNDLQKVPGGGQVGGPRTPGLPPGPAGWGGAVPVPSQTPGFSA
ncbi:signal-induced proliferation-associated 1-like protein 3, partial [Alligator sinensis]|uniref:Signal-induced proliferation-associated 1-like protein 3 n=1 Tax=Alligator sinensis TaxID=38654 RepID=A0A3Q0HB66_ALLSI